MSSTTVKTPRSAKSSWKATLKRILQLNPPPLAISLLCPDIIRLQRACNKVLAAYDPQNATATLHHERYRSPSVQYLDAASMTSEEMRRLTLSLSELSLFTSQRIVVLERVDSMSKAVTSILCSAIRGSMTRESRDTTKSYQTATSLICIGQKLPATNALYKSLSTVNQLVSIPALSAAELRQWIERELDAHGLRSYPRQLLQQLTEHGNSLPDLIFPMISMLGLYAEEGKLSEEDLRLLLPVVSDPNQFELFEAIATAKMGTAYRMIYELIDRGHNAIALLGLLARNTSNYLRIQSKFAAGQSQVDIRSALGMNQWVFNKNLQVANHYTPSQLCTKLQLLLRSDSKLKNHSLGPELILSELVAKLGPS